MRVALPVGKDRAIVEVIVTGFDCGAMGKFHTFLLTAMLIAGQGLEAMAQSPGPALSEARYRLACGTGRVVGAETLPDGSIRVTCEQDTAGSRLPQELAGASLTPETAAVILGTAVFLGVVLGDSDSSTTSSSVNY